MIFFYQIFIHFFNFFIHAVSLFNKKAKLFVQGRKNIFTKLRENTSPFLTSDYQRIWFHCASLGEFEQARPLLEQFRSNKQKKIIITFFSPSGYEVQKNYKGADGIFYLPVDTKSNVKKFLECVNPSLVFFVKYDFWYNFLNQLHQKKIPTYLVSANLRQEQFNGVYGKYLRKALVHFTHIFVQNESSANLLSEQNVKSVTVSGDLRYDKAYQTASAPKKNSVVEHFINPSSKNQAIVVNKLKIIVCGSTWEKDEQIISNIQALIPTRLTDGQMSVAISIKLIVAPHEVDEEHIKRIISLFPDKSLRYSEISKEPVSSALDKLQEAKVLIIDNIGMLSYLYQYADIAYIGGGFGSGIHNILEAVAFGVPVLFGPNHRKFPEAQEVIEKGGGFSITNENDLQKIIALLFSDEKILKMASITCRTFVEQRRGAVQKIVDRIL